MFNDLVKKIIITVLVQYVTITHPSGSRSLDKIGKCFSIEKRTDESPSCQGTHANSVASHEVLSISLFPVEGL